MDAFDFFERYTNGEFEKASAFHCSPPCQAYSVATPMEYRDRHPDLIKPVRELLQATRKPYVIENVENARRLLINPLKLCGSMFGLPFWRHRYFEIAPPTFVLLPPCTHKHAVIMARIDGEYRPVQTPILATGGGDGKRAKRKTHRPRQPVAEIRWGMGIDWMTQQELSESIPPAYTEFIGRHLMKYVIAEKEPEREGENSV